MCEEAANLLVSHTACAGLAPGADKASRGITLIKSSCLFAYAMLMETIQVMPERAGGSWKWVWREQHFFGAAVGYSFSVEAGPAISALQMVFVPNSPFVSAAAPFFAFLVSAPVLIILT